VDDSNLKIEISILRLIRTLSFGGKKKAREATKKRKRRFEFIIEMKEINRKGALQIKAQ